MTGDVVSGIAGLPRAISDAQDDCLLAIEDGHPLPLKALRALPPWRAVMMARVAAKAGIGLERGTLEELQAEARRVGGAGELAKWRAS